MDRPQHRAVARSGPHRREGGEKFLFGDFTQRLPPEAAADLRQFAGDRRVFVGQVGVVGA